MRYTVVMLVIVLTACSGASPQQITVEPLLEIVAGDGQTDTVGKTLPVQLGAKLTDGPSGQPLAGRILNWVIVDGGGSVFATVTQTGSDGVGKNSWTLGPLAGGQKLVARYIDPETGDPITLDTAFADAMPGPAVTFAVVPDSLHVYASVLGTDTLGIEIHTRDSYGNAAPACADQGWTSADATRIWSLGSSAVRAGKQVALFRVNFSIGGQPVKLVARPSCGAADSVVVQTYNQ